MANDEFREQQEASRRHGLQARQETRVERAIRREVCSEIVMAFLEFEATDIRGRADINIERAIAMVREIGTRETS
jgi:hypothetical protein